MSHAIRRPMTAFSLDPVGKSTKSFKDEGHLAFIRKLPSPISGAYGCDPAHISAGSPIHNKKRTGGGQRASDCWVTPLTRAEHDAQHAHGDELAWWRSHGIDPFDLAIKLYENTGDAQACIAILRKART